MPAQFTDITEAESAALEALYTATTGASWTDKTDWDGATAGDCYGVTVAGGVVTALDLRANNLVGEINGAIVSALDSCETFHVEGNPSLNVSCNLDDIPASMTDFVADYTDSDLAGGSSAMSAVDIEEISIRSASLSSLSVATIVDRIYADRASFNHATPILRVDNLEDETLAYIATHGVSVTPTELAAIDTNIKAIKAGTPVVLSSLTADLSTVNGTAFVTRSSVDLRPYKPFKLSFSDGSQALVGWGKSYGTGETLGSAIIDDDCADDDTADWKKIDATVTFDTDHYEVGYSAENQYVYKDTGFSITVGAVYKLSSDLKNGTLASVGIVLGAGLNLSIGSAVVRKGYATTTDWANAFACFTGLATTDTVYLGSTMTVAGNYEIKNIALKQVLTPDTSGIVIASASGGATENWSSDGGINPNAASFTLTITNS